MNKVKTIEFKTYYGNISAVAVMEDGTKVKVEVEDMINIVIANLNQGNEISKLKGENVPRIRVATQ